MKTRFQPSAGPLKEVSPDWGMVDVLFEIGDDRRDVEAGPMYRIRASDGKEADAFSDELDPEPESQLLIWDEDEGWKLK